MAAMQVFQLVIGRSFVKSLKTVEFAGVYQISRVLFRLSRSGRRSVGAARLQVTIIFGGVEGRRERIGHMRRWRRVGSIRPCRVVATGPAGKPDTTRRDKTTRPMACAI